MTRYAIEVENLLKRYGDHAAVDGISFTVEAGEVFGMLGPNGAGKTTTVECIEGLRQPDQGTIRVLGMVQGKESQAIKARLGVGLQSTGLFPRLTVRETIELYATFFPKALPTGQLIDLVGLREKANAQTQSLSGGQKQRLTMALALVNDPDVLFLDEPTAAMDPAARRGVWEIIKSLRGKGKTIVLTTHYMEEAAHLCDRVAVVDHGKIIAEGAPDALVRQHFTETAIEFATPAGVPLEQLKELSGVTRVLTENGSVTLFSTEVPVTVTELLTLSRAGGFALDHFTVRGATLEDLFLRLTGRRIRD
jgi:ABC-2 type transport system ATP-binding protein